jgi:hypothetical protein
MAPSAAFSASQCAALFVAACVVTIFVFDVTHEDIAINREGVSTASTEQAQLCADVHTALARQHDQFWQAARTQVVTQFGQGVANKIQVDFTNQMNSIETRMLQKGCAQAAASDGACHALRMERNGVAKAVEEQVSNLLAQDKTFAASKKTMAEATKDLETRLVQLHCTASLTQTNAAATTAATTAAAATTTAKVAAKAGAKQAVQTKNLAETATQEHMEHLKREVQEQHNDINEEKASIAREERHMAHALAEEKESLERHKDAIGDHQAEIAKLKKKMTLVDWAKNQRDALLHGKAIPPPTAAEYHGDTPQPTVQTTETQMDAAIGSMFEDSFEQTEESVPATGLLQIESEKKDANKATLDSFKKVLKTKEAQNHEATRLRKTTHHIVKKLAAGHPAEATAAATSDALEAVNEQVRYAAHEAATKAAHRAADRGLGAKDTLTMVKAAARAAAANAAKQSHTVFEHALQKQPTPQMMAKAHVKAASKELSAKKQDESPLLSKYKEAEKATTAKMKKDIKKNPDFQRAIKKSVGKHHSVAETKKLIEDAENQAVQAEAAAWNSDVDDADSKEDILAAIHAFQKKNPHLTLPQATQKWEENEVVKLKHRFALHYAKGLNINPTTKEGHLRNLHEVDRQRINAEKLVLENAEMQSIVAKRNAEKSAKSTLRMRDAAKRYELAARDTLHEKVKQIHAADNQANEMQRQAVTDVLARDASETLKAKTAANKAKAQAMHAEAAKTQALAALNVAKGKLTRLSKAAAAGTAILGTKLRTELKARQEQVQAQLEKVKEATAREVEARTRRELKVEYEAKLLAAKKALHAAAANATAMAEVKASKVVEAAEQAAASAKAMAAKEAQVAAESRDRSKQVANEALTRAKVIKAAEAQQMASLAQQKVAALKHFKEFSSQLKKLESEKSGKAEKRTEQSEKREQTAVEEAARAARFASVQKTEAELQASKALRGRVGAARETLKNAMYMVSTMDTRARGQAAKVAEKRALVSERAKKKAAVIAKQEKTQEVAAKKVVEMKETKTKAADKIKEVAKKKVIKETQTKNNKIKNEGYQKGLAHAKALFDAQQKKISDKKAAVEKAVKTHAVESKAKALLKQANKVKQAENTPEQTQARKLVKEAVATTAINHNAGAAVDHASKELRAFLHSKEGAEAQHQEHKVVVGKPVGGVSKAAKAVTKAVKSTVKSFNFDALDQYAP